MERESCRQLKEAASPPGGGTAQARRRLLSAPKMAGRWYVAVSSVASRHGEEGPACALAARRDDDANRHDQR